MKNNYINLFFKKITISTLPNFWSKIETSLWEISVPAWDNCYINHNWLPTTMYRGNVVLGSKSIFTSSENTFSFQTSVNIRSWTKTSTWNNRECYTSALEREYALQELINKWTYQFFIKSYFPCLLSCSEKLCFLVMFCSAALTCFYNHLQSTTIMPYVGQPMNLSENLEIS